MSDETVRDMMVKHVLNAVCNVMIFPKPARPMLLGQDMRPLAEAIADELLERGWRPPITSPGPEFHAAPDLERLARIIAGGDSPLDLDRIAAGEVWDAGWRPPARTVTTVEELDALADEAYVKDANCWTWIICQSLDPDNEQDPTAHPWAYGLGVSGPTSLVALPATVLWEPEEDE